MPSEKQQQKSPAEFFSDNAAIAGFDNPGKSLYTTVRELVENGLDAAEAIQTLPSVSVRIEEMSQREFNEFRSVRAGEVKDSMFSGSSKGRSGSTAHKKDMYYTVRVQDNGCGMSHSSVPQMLGVVLSGSKYGVRQTRGKFGLGSKMALIWGKKSTGLPLEVITAHRPKKDSPDPEKYTTCVLDIDIYKNKPRVSTHTSTYQRPSDPVVGTTFTLTISGNWSTHGKYIKSYLQKLAVITPYASMDFEFVPSKDPKSEAKHQRVEMSWARTSDNMPPAPKTVQHHPSSLNNLLLQSLLDRTRARTFLSFLINDLSSVTKPVASRLIAELAGGDKRFEPDMHPSEIDSAQINRVVQLLKACDAVRNPSGSCLSGAGEYNLRLGVQRQYNPEMLFTTTSKAGAHDGHPFILECCLAYGGGCRPGINVTRFANRIPLLFEPGSDVATKVCNKSVDWKQYHIDPVASKVEVFISLVSTKVPFKGTGKEYIPDSISSVRTACLRSIQVCCRQVKEVLGKDRQLKEAKARRGKLKRYEKSAASSLANILKASTAKEPPGFEGIKARATLALIEEKLGSMSESLVKEKEDDDLIKSADKGRHPDERAIVFDRIEDAAWDWEDGVVDTGRVWVVMRKRKRPAGE